MNSPDDRLRDAGASVRRATAERTVPDAAAAVAHQRRRQAFVLRTAIAVLVLGPLIAFAVVTVSDRGSEPEANLANDGGSQVPASPPKALQWSDGRVHLAADGFELEYQYGDTQAIRRPAITGVGTDEVTASTSRSSAEGGDAGRVTRLWSEQGTQMEFSIDFDSDGSEWWVESVWFYTSASAGLKHAAEGGALSLEDPSISGGSDVEVTGDFMHLSGEFFRTPMGSTYHGDFSFSGTMASGQAFTFAMPGLELNPYASPPQEVQWTVQLSYDDLVAEFPHGSYSSRLPEGRTWQSGRAPGEPHTVVEEIRSAEGARSEMVITLGADDESWWVESITFPSTGMALILDEAYFERNGVFDGSNPLGVGVVVPIMEIGGDPSNESSTALTIRNLQLNVHVAEIAEGSGSADRVSDQTTPVPSTTRTADVDTSPPPDRASGTTLPATATTWGSGHTDTGAGRDETDDGTPKCSERIGVDLRLPSGCGGR